MQQVEELVFRHSCEVPVLVFLQEVPEPGLRDEERTALAFLVGLIASCPGESAEHTTVSQRSLVRETRPLDLSVAFRTFPDCIGDLRSRFRDLASVAIAVELLANDGSSVEFAKAMCCYNSVLSRFRSVYYALIQRIENVAYLYSIELITRLNRGLRDSVKLAGRRIVLFLLHNDMAPPANK